MNANKARPHWTVRGTLRTIALAKLLHRRGSRWPPIVRGMLWSSLAGLCFVISNTIARGLVVELPVLQAQFLRYLFGVLVIVPLMFRTGLAVWMPKDVAGQFKRGLVHSAALFLWFAALPHITLTNTTAIGFATPVFIMLGARFVLKEKLHWDRWVAALMGLAGVFVVVGGGLMDQGGFWNLLMLLTCPAFAASFLISKALTRTESAGVIVLWQSITVGLFSLPLALLVWVPLSFWQWFGFFMTGLLGSGAHYFLMRSYQVADISATQSVKFLDLVWAALLGWAFFGDMPTRAAFIGGTLIALSTFWAAHRESKRKK